MTVYRVRDPVKGDDHSLFDEGVLDAPVATLQVSIRLATLGSTIHSQCSCKRNAHGSGRLQCSASGKSCAGYYRSRCHHPWSAREARGHVR